MGIELRPGLGLGLVELELGAELGAGVEMKLASSGIRYIGHQAWTGFKSEPWTWAGVCARAGFGVDVGG